MKRTMSKVFNAITFLCISLICVIGLGFGLKASGVTGENFVTRLLTFAGNDDYSKGPTRNKDVESNNDGSYKLSLSVVGESEKKVAKSNIIVILDISGSMDDSTGYVYTKSNNGGYGLVDGKYVSLSCNWGGNCTYNGVKYTGDRYSRSTSNQTRMQAAKAAINSLAEGLLSKNGQNGNPSDTFEMALVTFSDHAKIAQQATTSLNTFKNTVNGLRADGGTNWEASLTTAATVNFGANDNDATYVIFVSDGDPTFRDTKGNYNPLDDYRYSSKGVYGNGSPTETRQGILASVTVARCYEHALDDAQALVAAGKTFYGISAYGSADRVKQLVTESGAPAANYFSAEDTTQLELALESILDDISTVGYGQVEIDDGTTSKVTTTTGVDTKLLTVDESSYKYYKNGVEWAGAPAAHLDDNGVVVWNLGNGVLENGVEYKVTFDVWPSQYTLDLIANLKNGSIKYEDLDENIRLYLTEDYQLATNTVAELKYNDTRNSEGLQTVKFTPPKKVATDSYKLKVEKLWENSLDNRNASGVDTVTLNVFQDKTKVDSIVMNEVATGWSGTTYIAPGMIVQSGNKVEILETGHDYSLAEPENLTYHWELTSEVVHPMMINGVVTRLVLTDEVTISEGNYLAKDGKEYYKIKDKVYVRDDSNEALTATNSRRSVFELNKIVNGEEAPADAKFKYNVKITNSMADLSDTVTTDDDEIWFSVLADPSDKNSIIKNLETTAEAAVNDAGERTGYYKVPSGTAFDVTLQAGWNLRVINLPTESQYVVEETTMPQGFIFESVDALGTKEGKKVTGKIAESNKEYNVTYTNKYILTDVVITKKWVDNKDQDGVRPDSIQVQLYADGEKVGEAVSVEGNKTDDTWTYTFAKQNKYNAEGKEIVYTVDEVEVDANYRKTSDGKSLEIVNEHDIAKADVTINKKWADKNNQDAVRPTSVMLQLYANGDPVGEPVKLEGNMTGEVWSYTFPKLDVNKAGKAIVYTVDEPNVPGDYRKSVEGLTVTNSRETATTSASVHKIWDDKDNQDGKRPTEIKVTLSNGTEVTLNEGNKWTQTVTGLPKYRNNNGTAEEIKYTWTEQAELPNDYQYVGSEVDKEDATLTHITNKRTLETTQATIVKVWEDDSDRDGIQPDSLKVYLNGKEYELTEKDGWTLTVPDLPKNKDGKPIEYVWTEENVNGYTSDKEVKGTVTTFTNKHESATADVTMTKVWEDNNNQDGIRPAFVKVQLYANGKAVGEVVKVAAPKGATNETTKWTYTFPKQYVNEAGEPITYTVKEVEKIFGYKPTEKGLTITNTHETYKTEVKVSKVWDDGNNQDGKQPGSVTVRLMNGETEVDHIELNAKNEWKHTFKDLAQKANGKDINYTVKEDAVEGYKTTILGDKTEGFIITNSYTPGVVTVAGTKTWADNNNQDGVRPTSVTIKVMNGDKQVREALVEPDEEGNWTYSFTGLPEYENGKKITYTVEEKAVEGYEPRVDGYNIENYHKTATTEVAGKKTWSDKDNQDGKRPAAVKVYLFANGEKVAEAVVNDETQWSYKFENLPTNKDGKAIRYTVEEEEVPGYEPRFSGYNIENVHVPETVNIVTEKEWKDEKNNDKVRPESIKINLLADGKVIDSKTVTEKDNWSAQWLKLDKYKAGKEIKYTITEDTVAGYESDVQGYKVTNTHKLLTTEFTASKSWADGENQDGVRPTSVKLQLYADGTPEGEVVVLNGQEETPWSYTWTGLQKLVDGKAIVYTVVEVPETTVNEEGVEEVQDNGYSATYEYTTDEESGANLSVVVTNTYNPEKTTYTVVKSWDDNDDQDGIRPDSVKVQLYADGEKSGEEVEVKAEDGWTYTFTGLDKYRDGGVAIEYTVAEVAVEDGYEAKVEGNTIINKHDPEQVSVAGNVYWDDEDDKDELRPDKVEICLYANGEKVECKEVTPEDDKWTYEFNDLDKKENGEDITYTVTESLIDEYEITPDGYDFTNKHEPGEVLGEKEEDPEVAGKNNDNPETGDTILPFALLLLTSLGGISITAKKIVDRQK